MTALVEVEDLVVRYGPAVAVDGVSLTLGAGERVALIGANGAGKSSLLNAVCGVVRPAAGTRPGGGRRRHREDAEPRRAPRAHAGAGGSAGVPEPRRSRRTSCSVPSDAPSARRSSRRRSGTFGAAPEARERLERIYTLLPKLYELRDRPAGRTSGGEQQMVAIGRALMAEPRALAIDELSLGLAPLVVEQLAEFLLRLNEEERRGDPPRGAERLARVRPLRACVRPRDRSGRRSRARVGTSANRPEVHSAYLGGDPG